MTSFNLRLDKNEDTTTITNCCLVYNIGYFYVEQCFETYDVRSGSSQWGDGKRIHGISR